LLLINVKREFPRIPFYADFWQWAAWGEALMNLHIGCEAVAPFALTRADVPGAKAMLRADAGTGSIQREEAKRPNHPRKIRHLSFCRLQRKSHRPAYACNDCEQ
jgi:hypothetical protein